MEERKRLVSRKILDRHDTVLIKPIVKAVKPDIPKNRLEESDVIQTLFSEWFLLEDKKISFNEYIYF